MSKRLIEVIVDPRQHEPKLVYKLLRGRLLCNNNDVTPPAYIRMTREQATRYVQKLHEGA